MEILFTKTGKADHVFSCKRKEGTVTWKHVSTFFMLHDLGHYAVETILPLKKGFFGMVAAGTDINDFDLPKEQRNFQLSSEIIFAEHLVNLVVIDYAQGRMENLVEVFASLNDEYLNSDLLKLVTEKKLEQIRKTYRGLMQQWNSLPQAGSLKLFFEE